jgi:hypothetical protein
MRDFRNYSAEQPFVGLIDQILHALLLQPHRLRARSHSNSSAGTSHSHSDSRDGTGLGLTSLGSPSARSLPTAGPARHRTVPVDSRDAQGPERLPQPSWGPDASVPSPAQLPRVAATQARSASAAAARLPPLSQATAPPADSTRFSQAHQRPREEGALTASLSPGRWKNETCVFYTRLDDRVRSRGSQYAQHTGTAIAKPRTMATSVSTD